MSTRSLVLLTVAVAVAARLAPPVPVPVAVVVAAVAGLVLARPARVVGAPRPTAVRAALAGLALVLVVAARAAGAEAALGAPPPRTVAGEAVVRTDPERLPGQARAVVSVGGRRYVLSAGDRLAPVLAAATVGDRLWLTARAGPLRGAPAGWVLPRHLAGRLTARRLATGPAPRPWDRVVAAVRSRVVAGADALPAEQRALYLGLVVGDDRDQSALLRHRFRAAGLAHLLAVSGQNVAVLLVAVAPVLRRLPLRTRAFGAVGVLALFVGVARPEASVLRAAAMALVGVVAVALGRRADAGRVAALGVLGLLVADPLLVHSVGLRLSVAATAGLVLLARPLADRLPGPRPLARAAAASLAAQAATAPVIVPLAGGVPAVGVVANLLAVPAAGAVMVHGLTVGLLAGAVHPGLAGVLMLPARALVAWTEGVAAVAASAPLPLWGWWRTALVAAGTVVVLHRRAPRAVRAAASAAVLVAAVVPGSGPSPGVHRPVPGAVVVVGGCGARVLDLTRFSGRTDRLLDELLRRGARRFEVVLAGSSRASVAAARDVAAVARVGHRVAVGTVAPPGLSALDGRRWSGGGVEVRGPPGRAEVRAVPCRLAA